MQTQKNYIIPLVIKLDKKIQAEVYYLKLPSSIKEKLIHLEELSKNGNGFSGRFIKEFHNLPLNSLKNLFISYFPGVVNMKPVRWGVDDSRWIVSTQEIAINLVCKIIKEWISAFYIEETELEQKRNNSDNVKKYAQKIIDEINQKDFENCSYKETVILFDEEKVCDNDAYSLLPLLAVNQLRNTEVIVNNEKLQWLYSGKNEIVTDPCIHTENGIEIKPFSFVANFSVQTIPPSNELFLNINLSSRRWITENKSKNTPYIPDKKSVYLRTIGNKLLPLRVKYQSSKRCVDWLYADKNRYKIIYGELHKDHNFENIITDPQKFMRGVEGYDAYVPFEYGMNDGTSKMHNMDAGITHNDRLQLFEDIKEKLSLYSTKKEKLQADKVDNNSTYCNLYFDGNFDISDEEMIREEFISNIKAIQNDRNLSFEVWYSSGLEILNEEIVNILKNHFKYSDVLIQSHSLNNLGDALECRNPKKNDNLEGYSRRVNEIQEQISISKNVTMSIIIIHNQDFYKDEENNITATKLDPKNALRTGFALTGRLTQFITKESYDAVEKKKGERCNFAVKGAILDAYRQLGFLNPIKPKISKYKPLPLLVGIHVINYKKLLKGINTLPFPIILSCDLQKKEIYVETQIILVHKSTKEEKVEMFNCPYYEFPLKLVQLLKEERNLTIKPDDKFIMNWFENLDSKCLYHVFIEANGTTRKIINGISNRNIEKMNKTATEEKKEFIINEKLNYTINLRNHNNINLIRIRTNDEVPDYVPMFSLNKKEKKRFKSEHGAFRFESVFYSLAEKPSGDDKSFLLENSKLNSNDAFLHRNIIEIYPIHRANQYSEKEKDCVLDTHNLRKISIQYENKETILPMILHIAKKLEEYLI